jgi:hypothetical protein
MFFDENGLMILSALQPVIIPQIAPFVLFAHSKSPDRRGSIRAFM